MSLAQIYNDTEKFDISLFSYNLGDIDAACLELNGKYAIFFDSEKESTVAEISELMAHELGHCVTGATHKQGSKWDLVLRHEHKANKWAFERYLPYKKLCAAMKLGYCEAWQLAELFDFTESYIKQAIMYYSNNKGFCFCNDEPI